MLPAPVVVPLKVEPFEILFLKRRRSWRKNRRTCIVMCTSLVAHSGDEFKIEWILPRVTHEFSYPSDEKIMPNLKANFSK
jgi:hypothetical protein